MTYKTMDTPVIDFNDLACAYQEEFEEELRVEDLFVDLHGEPLDYIDAFGAYRFFLDTNRDKPWVTPTVEKASIVIYEYFNVPKTYTNVLIDLSNASLKQFGYEDLEFDPYLDDELYED